MVCPELRGRSGAATLVVNMTAATPCTVSSPSASWTVCHPDAERRALRGGQPRGPSPWPPCPPQTSAARQIVELRRRSGDLIWGTHPAVRVTLELPTTARSAIRPWPSQNMLRLARFPPAARAHTRGVGFQQPVGAASDCPRRGRAIYRTSGAKVVERRPGVDTIVAREQRLRGFLA